MSELKCPFCQQEYIITKDDFCFGQQRCVCRNPNCEFDGWHFPVKLVSELIRTRKALDDFQEKLRVAMDALKEISLCYQNAEDRTETQWFVTARDMCDCADEALEQITALEQKEHFADASKKIEQKE